MKAIKNTVFSLMVGLPLAASASDISKSDAWDLFIPHRTSSSQNTVTINTAEALRLNGKDYVVRPSSWLFIAWLMPNAVVSTVKTTQANNESYTLNDGRIINSVKRVKYDLMCNNLVMGELKLARKGTPNNTPDDSTSSGR